MKIILTNPVKDDARFSKTGIKELVQHQGHTYRVLNYVRRLTACECFIRGLVWALSCIMIIPIIFCRANVSRLLNEARTKSIRKIIYTPIDLQTKFDKLKKHIRNCRVKPAFFGQLVGQRFSLENYSNLKKWLKARDTLIVWAEIAKEAKIEVGNLDICGFPDVEATVKRASKFGKWCTQNANEVAKLKTLGLDNKQLTRLPEEVGDLSQLITLDLGRNKLKHVPEEVCNLSQLRLLFLNNNKLRDLPKEVCKLSQLRDLRLNNNKLRDLPEEVCKLSKLTDIHLGHNQLTHLPKEIRNLSQLTTLTLDGNHLTHLPEEVWKLSQLAILTLNSNHLTHLSEEVGKLSQLKLLYLGFNQLTHLPNEVGNLSQLKDLCLVGNPLRGIPQEIANLEKRW